MRYLLLLLLCVGCSAQPKTAVLGNYTSKHVHVVALRQVAIVPDVVPDVLPAGICSNCKGKGRLGDGTVSTICPVCKGTGKTGSQEEPQQFGALGDGMIDRARDRAIIEAGLTWDKIRFIAGEAFAWALKSKNIRTAIEAPSAMYAEAPKSGPVNEYKAAYDSAVADQKPFIVFITADWCKYCHQLERESLGPLRAKGELDDCEYIALDFDRDPEAKQIAGQSNLPVLMRYQFVNGKWTGKKLVGYKPKDEVLSFLKGSK